jgi:hypothetical protein
MAGSAFDEELAKVVDAANRQRGMTPSDDLIRALNTLADLPPQQRETARTVVGNALARVASPTGAGFLSVWLGAGVENGATPEPSCQPVIDTFMKWSRTVETLTDGSDAETDGSDAETASTPRPDAETINGLQLLGQALVAHIGRLPKVREWMRDTEEIREEFERIAGISIGAAWVVQLITQCSGQLVVLNTAEKIGVLVRYANISNCFHLFTLLQAAVAGAMPDALPIDPRLYEIACGRQQGECGDKALWHYGQPTVPRAELPATVWGEMPPSSIASIDGQQALLLWPRVMARSWDSGFFSPILATSLPEVDILKSLSSDEVDAWWTRLGLPAPKRPVRRSWRPKLSWRSRGV